MNARTAQSAPKIGVVMGSNSDWDTMRHACEVLKEFGVSFEAKVLSAHRMPDEMFAYADAAQALGLRVCVHEPTVNARRAWRER
jgi:5-(carboxyamino)imidazole ribonucleotide mutase